MRRHRATHRDEARHTRSRWFNGFHRPFHVSYAARARFARFERGHVIKCRTETQSAAATFRSPPLTYFSSKQHDHHHHDDGSTGGDAIVCHGRHKPSEFSKYRVIVTTTQMLRFVKSCTPQPEHFLDYCCCCCWRIGPSSFSCCCRRDTLPAHEQSRTRVLAIALFGWCRGSFGRVVLQN